MPRLRHVDSNSPGLTRRRSGRGFVYLDEVGSRIRDRQAIERIRELAIPPAWTDVWICADPNGHLQAVGSDAAGRRQYLYHPRWRDHRDRRKFEEMVRFGQALPNLRSQVTRRLRRDGLSRERVLAAAIGLLDRPPSSKGAATKRPLSRIPQRTSFGPTCTRMTSTTS